jgi:hypothetical protein
MGLFSNDDNKNNARLAKQGANKKLSKAKKVDLGKAKKQSTKQLKAAEAKGTGALYEGRDLGIGYIDQGVQGAVAKDQQALDLYSPLAAAAGQGAEKYGNFFGLGGQEGFNTAQSEFQASPLYQAMVGEGSQGQQVLDRQANARGNPYNATDTLKYQGDLAGRYVNDYTAGLRPYLDQQGQYANAQAGILGNMGNRLYGGGVAQGGMAYGTGQNVSNLTQGIGTTQATGVNVPLAQSAANLTAQQGQNEADMYANIVAANNAATQNKWGAINAGISAAGTLGGAYLGKPPVA